MFMEVAVAVLAIWIIGQFLKGSPKQLFGHYSQEGGFQQIKERVAYVYLSWINAPERLLPKCDLDATDASEYGLVASEKELALENPHDLARDENAMDQISVSGLDKVGNVLLASIVRRHNRWAETWIYLKMSNGDEYQLPNHPDGRVYNTDGHTFSANGLTFEVLEPLRRWRVSFNGVLRKGIRHEWDEKSDEDNVHVKFNFIWSPIYAPFDAKFHVNAKLLSKAIATEQWTQQLFENLNLQGMDWYDQWGQLQGTLKIGTDEEQVLAQMRGRKLRKFGVRNLESIHRYANFDIYSMDGCVIHLQSSCNTKGLTNFLNGYAIFCNGDIEPLTYCDFTLYNLAEDQNIPKSFCIHLKTSKRSYHLQINVSPNGFTMYKGDLWNLKVHVKTIDVIVNNFKGYGVMELGYCHKEGCPVPKHSPTPFLVEGDVGISDGRLFAISLTNPRSRNGNVVGGKGMSLGLMKSLKESKFIVPSGVCITVAAYWHHLKENPDIGSAIQHLQDVCWKNKDGDLQDECQKVFDIVTASQLSSELKSEIKSSLEEVFNESLSNIKLAVRSSAIGEDGDETSAAGQNDTCLGITFSDDLWDAVTKCWASQYSFVAVQYKRQHGQLINAGMSVVLQEMVPAIAAGVLFTRDPVTGSRDSMVITANYGLGESVVSASAEPDTISLRRTWNDRLSVIKKYLGKKALKIIMKEDGGTEENRVSEEDVALCCISDEMAVKLGELGIFLENAFGNPRDIEWAVCEDQIYLLQSRAITTSGLENSDYQITHEFDSALPSDHEKFTKANVGEVFPGATTPLTMSLIIATMDIVFMPSIIKLRKWHPYPMYRPRLMTFSHNHVFISVFQMMSIGNSETRGINDKIVGFSILGRELIDDEDHKLLLRRSGTMSSMQKLTLMLPSIKQFFFENPMINECKKRYENGYHIQFDNDETSVGMYDKITQQLHVLKHITSMHIHATQVSSAYTAIVFAILGAKETDVSVRIIRDAAMLMGSCTDVISADVPGCIKKLAAAIAASSEAKLFGEMSTEEALDWLANNEAAPGRQFQHFLREHGHRCFKEFELRSLPWEIDQSPLIPVFQNSLKTTQFLQDKKQDLSTSEAIEKLETNLSYIAKKLLMNILPACRKAVGIRENSKSIYIKVGNGHRQAFRRLAKQMVHEGRLPDPDLIFFLTYYEIGQLLKTRSARLLSRAIRRKNVQPSLENLKFPDLINGPPKPINVKSEDNVHRASSVSIQALPASQGVAKGTARVIFHISEAKEIQAGDILITHSTDIGWSPFFPLLSGIVTEIGGLISHGAVVAREYGLPCLTGAEGATTLFRSGDKVVLDASKGILALVSQTSDQNDQKSM